MNHTSLLTAQPALPRIRALSTLIVRAHTGLFEELPPRAFVKKQGYTIAYKSEA
jgi:hypothetical protein